MGSSEALLLDFSEPEGADMNDSQAMTLNAAPAKAASGYEYPKPRSKALSSVQPSAPSKMRVTVRPPTQAPKPMKGKR